MDLTDTEWELACDYNPLTRTVRYCYYNEQTKEYQDSLPSDLTELIENTTADEWLGHLSTSYIPFQQFYRHKSTNFSIWHEPTCLTKLRNDYIERVDDWTIRSKSLEMSSELQEISFDFDDRATLPTNPTSLDVSNFGLLQANKNKYWKANGKVSKDFVCFYRNNITQQCVFETPQCLETFQMASNNFHEWTPKLSQNINKFFYLHEDTRVCLWEMPFAYRMNFESHTRNSTKDDWRIFVSSEHPKPLYIHTASKHTQFEIPPILRQAEQQIKDPKAWVSGIHPITKLCYYTCRQHNITLWHLPSILADIKYEFSKKRNEEETSSILEKKLYRDSDYIYWDILYLSYTPKTNAITNESLEQSNSTTTSGKTIYTTFYKHRFTQECVTQLPPSTLSFVKTTKRKEWIKVSIEGTTISYYKHEKPIDKDPFKLLPNDYQQDPNLIVDAAEGICMWASPLEILAHHTQVAKQTEAQLVIPTSSSNKKNGDDSDDDTVLDPEDDIDNWLIYYDPNATGQSNVDSMGAMVKAKQRKAPKPKQSPENSKESSNPDNADDDGFGNLGGNLYGDDDDDDDGSFGGGLISSNAGGSTLGDLISSATFQLQGLRLGSLPNTTPTTSNNNPNAPRTELEEGVEIGGNANSQRRPSFSTFSFSTTQRHLNAGTKGQQLYFNTVTKRITADLPTCFDLFQANLEPERNTINDWVSAVGKIGPCPFYRYKHKSSIIMWHEPICVRNYRLNDYETEPIIGPDGQERAKSLMDFVKDWSIRFVGESNSAYYKNNKTLWYQTTIPDVLTEFQSEKKDIREWDSIMSSLCVGVVVYCHLKPNGDTNAALLHMPDCIKDKMKALDPKTYHHSSSQSSQLPLQSSQSPLPSSPAPTSSKDKYIQVSPVDPRFNANVSYQDNVFNWVLKYDSQSNTTYYANTQTLYLSTNIPKPLYLLGTSQYSEFSNWQQTTVHFDADGDVISLEQVKKLDQQAKQNPELTKGGVKLYIEKTCYEYIFNHAQTGHKIRVFHRPHVLRDHLRQSEKTFDWTLTRSADSTRFLYKNKQTGELLSDLPDPIVQWLASDPEALKSEHWVGCVDTTLKQAYYKHKPTNIMVSGEHEPPVLKEIRTKSYTVDEELQQWTIFANKADGRCYYQNKVTKQCIIGTIPTVLRDWSCTTKRSEWSQQSSGGVVPQKYWYHLTKFHRMWEQPDWIDDSDE